MTLKDFGLDAHDRAPPPPPEALPLPELRVFESIEDLDLMQEVLQQYAHVVRLRDWCITDPDTPTNQKAQVMNTCTNLLMQLSKTQIELHSAERLKKLEAVLIKCLKTLPDHTVSEFMMLYEKEVLELNRAP
jgi:hypothetical protein